MTKPAKPKAKRSFITYLKGRKWRELERQKVVLEKQLRVIKMQIRQMQKAEWQRQRRASDPEYVARANAAKRKARKPEVGQEF